MDTTYVLPKPSHLLRHKAHSRIYPLISIHFNSNSIYNSSVKPTTPPLKHRKINMPRTHHLIQIPDERRPYYTNLSFVANDFRRWGHRVDTYGPNSLWIKEHLKKDAREDLRGRQRPRLLLLWANQVLRRDQQREEAVDSVGSLMADFITGLLRSSKSLCPSNRRLYHPGDTHRQGQTNPTTSSANPI